ncbi:MAG TPA: GNAT family N-acetyltransferase [Candidatus Saccharimonadaceae bacterium]|jgi:predicted GNAT family acetyltransferase|nr:GNAT family N-acetyltransferase [Candidatus Saccharimonadaceae bacterium]
MSIDHGTGALTLERLSPRDLVEVFAYLDRDPVVNVYLSALVLRDSLAQTRDEFWAARRSGALVGLLYLGGPTGSLLPLADDRAVARALAERAAERLVFMPRRFQVIGPRDVVHECTACLAAAGHRPRLTRDQTYMTIERGALPPFERLPALRAARPADRELVYESGARLRLEELEEDPRDGDERAYARRVEEECRDGHTFVWIEDAALNFRASLSARTADAAQISGVYTPLEKRNRGIARRGVSELCARLFERSRHACLFVNDFNAPALAAYLRVGFRPVAAWASAFYERPPEARTAR